MLHEQAITWQDPDTHLPCKAKADGLAVNDGVLLDLKTTTSDAANPKKILQKVLDMGYHRQMAFYADGCKANGTPIKQCVLIFVDTSEPFAVGVYRLSEELLEYGRGQYKQALAGIQQYWNNPMLVKPAFKHEKAITLELPEYLKETLTVKFGTKKG